MKHLYVAAGVGLAFFAFGAIGALVVFLLAAVLIGALGYHDREDPDPPEGGLRAV